MDDMNYTYQRDTSDNCHLGVTYRERSIVRHDDLLLISKDRLSLVKMGSTLVKKDVNRLKPALES